MKPRLKATRAARELIKAYEPFVPEAVQRGRRWVVGYGHTAAAKPGVTVSREDAELLLIFDVTQAETAVKTAVGPDLSPAARDALISFAASIGTGAFKVSDVARLAASGRHEDAARAMESWVRAEQDGRLIVSERLQQRRKAEKTLYLEGLSAAAASTADAEPRIGALIDVDLAFETPEDDEESGDEAGRDELPAEPSAPEAGAAQIDPEAVIDPAAAEPSAAPASAASEPQADRKAEQDAAIEAVMARMAGEIASSIAAPPVEAETAGATAEAEADQPQRDYSSVRLGFSYLTAASGQAELDEVKPGPQSEPVAATMPSPVYATVSVESYAPPARDAATIAPPHPAEAPASAGGLSGESEGPDHDDAEDGYQPGVEDAALEPAIVAGPEASETPAEAPMPAEGRGDWVYSANLAVGLGLTGYGAWELISNLNAYLAAGLDFSLIGPVAFGAGVLLSAASGWYVVGALRRKGR